MGAGGAKNVPSLIEQLQRGPGCAAEVARAMLHTLIDQLRTLAGDIARIQADRGRYCVRARRAGA